MGRSDDASSTRRKVLGGILAQQKDRIHFRDMIDLLMTGEGATARGLSLLDNFGGDLLLTRPAGC